MLEWIKDNMMTSDFFFVFGAVCAIVLAQLCLIFYGRLSKFCKVLAWVHGLVLLTVAGIFIVFDEFDWPIMISWWIWFIFGWYCWLSVIVSLVLFVRERLKRKYIMIISHCPKH